MRRLWNAAAPRLLSPARLLLPALLLAGAGCGYRFVSLGSGLPGGVRRVCAPLLANRTAEPAAEALFTQALREALLRQGLAADGGCEATLHGELLSVSSTVGLLRAGGGVVSYRTSAALRLTLQRGDEVLRRVEVTGSEDFLPGLDVTQSEAHREASLQRLAPELAREALERLAE